MGIFGFVEDTINEGECFIYGHDWYRDSRGARCQNCGRRTL